MSVPEETSASRYVKLNKEHEQPVEEIRPGELNQPVYVPQVRVMSPRCRTRDLALFCDDFCDDFSCSKECVYEVSLRCGLWLSCRVELSRIGCAFLC